MTDEEPTNANDPLQRLYIENPVELDCRRGCGHTIRAETPSLAETLRKDHEKECRRENPHGYCPACGRVL